MHWNDPRIIPLALSALLAGMVNSVAGGGSLLTFPMLLAVGQTPLQANATSTVALVPGSLAAFWGYRQRFANNPPLVRAAMVMAVPSLVGGVVGSLLALRVGETLFAKLVPWLILLATGLFAFAPTKSKEQAKDPAQTTDSTEPATSAPPAPPALPAPPVPDSSKALLFIGVFQLLVATYGGFFGAGIGIMMLGALSLARFREIHSMNALKNLAAVLINAGAIVVFVVNRRADLSLAAVMAVAAIIGGRSGAQIAQRVGAKRVRQFISLLGFVIAVVLFLRQIRGRT